MVNRGAYDGRLLDKQGTDLDTTVAVDEQHVCGILPNYTDEDEEYVSDRLTDVARFDFNTCAISIDFSRIGSWQAVYFCLGAAWADSLWWDCVCQRQVGLP